MCIMLRFVVTVLLAPMSPSAHTQHPLILSFLVSGSEEKYVLLSKRMTAFENSNNVEALLTAC